MKNILSILFVSFLFSCGPNAQEKAAMEKAKQDSIQKEIEKQAEAKAIQMKAREDSIRQADETAANNAMAKQDDLSQKKEELSNAKADLAAEQDKLSRIKEFQFGRTPTEREQQIRDQTKIIEDLKNNIEDLEKQISELNK